MVNQKAKFVLFQGRDDKYYWTFKAENGEPLCHSEGYNQKQGAVNGIQSIMTNIRSGNFWVDDQV